MRIKEIFLGLTFALIWSSAFTSARIAMYDAPPFLFLSFRFLISGIIALIIARFFGENQRLSRDDWMTILVFGICQNTVYLGLNFVSMQWIEASQAAIIASSLPLVVAAFSWVFLKERINKSGFLGLWLGLFGMVLVMSKRTTDDFDIIGTCFCIVGVIALAIATIVVRKSSKDNILTIIGLQMLVGSFTLFPLSVTLETWHINFTYSLFWAFAYTTLFPGLIATLIWFKLLHLVGPIKAASFHFLNPFFGVVIAHLLLSENLTQKQFLGVIIIMIAIITLQRSTIYLREKS